MLSVIILNVQAPKLRPKKIYKVCPWLFETFLMPSRNFLSGNLWVTMESTYKIDICGLYYKHIMTIIDNPR